LKGKQLEEINDYIPVTNPYGNSYNPRRWHDVIRFSREYIQKLGKVMTIRFLYYRLIEEKDVDLPLSKDTYDSFVKVLTRARKDYNNPDYDIFRKFIIEDTRKRDIEEFFDWTKPTEVSLDYYILQGLTSTRYAYPYDKYVELWFEDAGMFGMYGHIGKKYRISTECVGGNLTFNAIMVVTNV